MAKARAIHEAIRRDKSEKGTARAVFEGMRFQNEIVGKKSQKLEVKRIYAKLDEGIARKQPLSGLFLGKTERPRKSG